MVRIPIYEIIWVFHFLPSFLFPDNQGVRTEILLLGEIRFVHTYLLLISLS